MVLVLVRVVNKRSSFNAIIWPQFMLQMAHCKRVVVLVQRIVVSLKLVLAWLD